MKTKTSLLTLFACATAGTTLLADHENYDGQDLYGRDFSYDSLVNSSWVEADLTYACFTGADLTISWLYRAVLTNADLTGATLRGAHLHNATLTKANLTNVSGDVSAPGANFTDADLSGGDFYYDLYSYTSDFDYAKFVRSNLTSADLYGATLKNADFTEATLTSADLRRATLTNADFTGATLTNVLIYDVSAQNVNFTEADLSGSDFYDYYYVRSDLSGAKFVRANLTFANLRCATLTSADFTGANLTDANLLYATLTDADFTGANLTDVDLYGAALTDADFTDSVITGTDFSSSSLTLSQLYLTKSYKDKTLSGVGLVSFDLSGESFSGFNLTGVDLSYATLTDADFTGANLTDANLNYATLTNADFTGATLTDASGYGVSAQNVNFTEADLSGSDFYVIYSDSDFSGAKFVRANLTDANLRYATLTNADFTEATLTDASIGGVSAQNVNFTDADLSGADFYYSASSDLSGAKFVRSNLTDANLYGATLTNADFTGATLTDASVDGVSAQNVNFTDADLSGADFYCPISSYYIYYSSDYVSDLSGAKFVRSNLTDANLNYATLTNADFTGATLTDASGYGVSAQNVNFTEADLSGSDFYYYYSDYDSDFSGAKFVRANLTFANLRYATLTSADFTDSVITGTDFSHSSLTLSQLYSTKSYKDKTLSGVGLGSFDLSGESFSGFNLTDADLPYATLTNADFTGATLTNVLIYDVSAQNVNFTDADLSGADFSYSASSDLSGAKFVRANLTNADFSCAKLTGADFRCSTGFLLTWNESTRTFSDKSISGKNVILADGTIGNFSIVSREEFVIRGCSLSAELNGENSFTGTLCLDAGARLNLLGDLEVKTGAQLKISNFGTISVANSGSVTLASGAKIVIDYAGTFDENTSFAVMNWTNSSNIVGLDSLTKGGNLSLLVDGVAYDTSLWDFSTENNALTIFGVATSVDPDPDVPNPDNPIIPDPDEPVIPDEPERVVISSASQSVDLTETDSAADFDGSLTAFSGTISGAGSLNSSGTLTFSGDASAHTGTTNITSGTFTVAESAKLGTGAFEVAGTLAISGSRTFSNATSGNGTLRIVSGLTTFTNDVGVKTLSVSQGASATLNAGVDLTHASANAQVAGTLNLLGARTVSAQTSGNGVISLASGSDVSFATAIGVKKLSVAQGATLRGSVSMTYGAAVELSLAGTLVLNADKGEKVSLGGGKVTLASSAKLDVVGGSSPARASSAQIAALERGSEIVLFENGTVSGDVVSFLRTDADLVAYAQNYTVVYDTANGLSVQVVKNAATLADGLDTSELSESFVDWALSDANAALSNLSRGFVNAANLGNLSGGNDPLLKAILGGNAGEARAILDRLSPKSYAAMVAMPVEAFNSDARNISARLEQRRYDRFSKRAQWEFFAQLQTNSVENDTATDAPTFDFDTTGLLAGADYKLDKNTMLGIALGASTGEAKVHNGGGKIESTDFRVTGFAGKTIENHFVNAGAQLGYASYDIKRNTDYGNASGDTTGWSAGLFADAGTVITLSEAKKIYATPYIGLAYMHTQADAFTESGSDKAFDADAISGDSLRARLGCGFSWGFAASGAVWRLGLDVAFSHDFLGDEVDIDVTAQDGSSITETAKALPEDMFSIGPSFNVDVSSSSSIYGGYTFNAGTDSSVNHSANVGFRMRF